MVKFSILAMYRRIFTISQGFTRALIGVGIIVLGWMISVTTVQIFTCTPIEGAWNHAVAERCIHQKKFYYGNAIANVITDMIMLLMPVPTVWRLNLSTRKKINVTAVFMLGGLYVLVILRSTKINSNQSIVYAFPVSSASVPSLNSIGTISLVSKPIASLRF